MSIEATDKYEHCYQAAFGLVFLEIEGIGHLIVADIYNTLRRYSGDLRLQVHNLMIRLNDSKWGWPEYERYCWQKLEAECREAVQSIQNLDTVGTLGRLKKDRLIEIHQQVLGTPLKKSVLVRDLISVISATLTQTDIVSIKQGLIEQLPTLEPISRRKLAEFVVRKIEQIYYSLRSMEQQVAVKDMLPYWKLWIRDPEQALEGCRQIAQQARHYAEPCWQNYPSPCMRFDCSCSINCLSEDEARQAITGSPI